MGANLQLFSVENGCILDGADGAAGGFKTTVYLGIAGISQLSSDKNGQKIVVDEVSYEEPARIGFLVSITAVSRRYPDALEAVGAIIRHFKDANTIFVGEDSWHGNTDGLVFIEPVIGEPDGRRRIPGREPPSLTIEYRIEVGINSEKGTPFRRVEKREIKSNIIN
jgi:hypothetical protein